MLAAELITQKRHWELSKEKILKQIKCEQKNQSIPIWNKSSEKPCR
jgi:hypothetical protein